LIFVPTFNEIATIEPLLDAFLALPTRSDVLVIDDRSTDGTTGRLAVRTAGDRRIGVIVRPGKLGIGSAHKLAWLHARRSGYSRLVTLDADLSHDPADVPRLLAALDAGADVAIGSRYAPGGKLDYQGWRLFLSRGANNVARMLLRLPITEYTTSLRAARLDRVPPGLVETIEDDGYAFFLTAAARFVRQGLRVVEVPIHFRNRHHGRSKIPRLEAVRGAVNLLRLSLDRDPVRGFALPERGEADCPACGRPYRIRTASGALTCLACLGRGSAPSS
jgi:dolichol-phosphate mannosyltransferase